MLTPIGLMLNFFGSIVLLGSDVKVVEKALKQIDPVHWVYMREVNSIVSESIDENLLNERAYPYEGPISANRWTWWPLSRFLNRHMEQAVPANTETEINIEGGWFRINGEKATFPDKRMIELEEGGKLRTRGGSLSAVYALLYEARMRRIYIYGVGLLALGFLLQLINSLGV